MQIYHSLRHSKQPDSHSAGLIIIHEGCTRVCADILSLTSLLNTLLYPPCTLIRFCLRTTHTYSVDLCKDFRVKGNLAHIHKSGKVQPLKVNLGAIFTCLDLRMC